MRVSVFAVGRMKSGPERELVERYFDRFAKAGPPLGLEFAGVSEIPESRGQTAQLRKAEEAQRIHEALDNAKSGGAKSGGTSSGGTALILLDERGKTLGSEAFAAIVGRMRDDGKRQLIVAIGGPDGHDPALRSRADLVLALGELTWPHQIARILIAEQLYRAATILAGHPYHRS
ncbi:ribosomal RNA large subunit methyltransferase H [Brucella melitensis F8/01-155]|uniref:23S rRNA (pseudouridine(1915)-N(3))-methyltransferase RlmH n=1 Tax=Brucella melitensis TaxID=29459 RepID=UPI0002D11F26|nr:23S rRNA (pseudouridine(1915)-N(3))-methyltransferase RlmH [Brucella melitensis]ENS66849.1 ribosomal RNA large subunit methyltransferase H [Brucella melitensis F8/01-155]MBN7690266.1 23S rRNA (pseudouridine(1915)-N(3))-methyltransferase RlmH [Brucella melitensis]MBN7693137.1 23S rRNA (pseudouridine(1915)-N(3))-methyltransferase RlmH [Brucella melitensis]MBN7702074.1 23S rRNA (pseudouridine(1915)-N(3))-methyltransferase RlmH [Brucella melitensis]